MDCPISVLRLVLSDYCEENNKLVYYGDNPTANYKGYECIDRHLENNRPIIVGVNHTIGRNQ